VASSQLPAFGHVERLGLDNRSNRTAAKSNVDLVAVNHADSPFLHVIVRLELTSGPRKADAREATIQASTADWPVLG